MKKPTKAELELRDNLRRATNHIWFATCDGCKEWKVVLDTESARQVQLRGDSEVMLKGLLESKPKMDEMGLDIIGKKTDYGLIVHIKPKEVAK